MNATFFIVIFCIVGYIYFVYKMYNKLKNKWIIDDAMDTYTESKYKEKAKKILKGRRK